jgi:hypothetical protein
LPLGRIYEPGAHALVGMASPRPNGHAPTLDAAHEELAPSWRKWLEWAELIETAGGSERD